MRKVEAQQGLKPKPLFSAFSARLRPCPCYKTPQQIEFFSKLSGRALVTKHPSRSTFSTSCQAVPLLQNTPADRLFLGKLSGRALVAKLQQNECFSKL
jgi:hypothetical protein